MARYVSHSQDDYFQPLALPSGVMDDCEPHCDNVKWRKILCYGAEGIYFMHINLTKK